MTNLNGARLFRVTIKAKDPAVDYTEPPGVGNVEEFIRQAKKMGRRTSYQVGRPNREVYMLVEAFDTQSHQWFTAWDKKATLPQNAPAPK